MNWTEFNRRIKEKVNILTEQNNEALAKGDIHTVQCNCNKLTGMDYVMTLLKKVKR